MFLSKYLIGTVVNVRLSEEGNPTFFPSFYHFRFVLWQHICGNNKSDIIVMDENYKSFFLVQMIYSVHDKNASVCDKRERCLR